MELFIRYRTQPHTIGIITESAVISDNRGQLPSSGSSIGRKSTSFRKKVARASFRRPKSVKGRKPSEPTSRYASGFEDNKIIPDIPGDIERKKYSSFSFYSFFLTMNVTVELLRFKNVLFQCKMIYIIKIIVNLSGYCFLDDLPG